MATTPPSITAAPTPPDRADRATFSARATASFDHLKNNAIPEISAVATNVYNNALDAAAQATEAATQAGLATTNGAAQVALASVQALYADARADAAAISAQDAAAAAGSPLWVSGTEYAFGQVAWSPLSFLNYRRQIAGAGTLDPSVDATNWRLLSGKRTFGQSYYFGSL